MENNFDKDDNVLATCKTSNDEFIDGLCQMKIFVNKEFSYVDYHADYKQKCKDELDFTEFSFIQGIEIINKSKISYKDLAIKFNFSNNAFSANDIHIKQVNEGEELALRMSFLKVDKLIIDSITEIVPSALNVQMIDSEGNIICENEYLFNILPIS